MSREEPASRIGGAPTPPAIVIGEPYLLSAFSPIAATFRFIERDFRGALLPLFACAVVGSLETLSLLLGLANDWKVMLVLTAVWLPISSYCSASMLAFTLRVMRGQPYRPRDVWRYHPSTPRLALLKLLSYALFGGLTYAVIILLKRAASIGPAVPFLVVPIAIALGVLLLLRLSLAPVVLVDHGLSVFGAVRASVVLTRGQSVALAIYGVVLTMIAGMSQAICGLAVLSTLATPGLVYLYQTLRGEPPG